MWIDILLTPHAAIKHNIAADNLPSTTVIQKSGHRPAEPVGEQIFHGKQCQMKVVIVLATLMVFEGNTNKMPKLWIEVDQSC
jgi:hypothetical protein